MKYLLVVGVQQMAVQPHSSRFVLLSHTLERINVLIRLLRKKEYTVVFSQYISEQMGETSWDAQIAADIREGDAVISHMGANPFFKSQLQTELALASTVIICGAHTNIAVRDAACTLSDMGKQVVVVSDCCSASSPNVHQFTLEDLSHSRKNVRVCSLQELS
ncbi:MAG: isochorismatase family cysteine hydrolase [Candidatus Woesearchaeota archaeon]